LTRGIARREGAALFDLVSGFVHSQALMALVQLRIPETVMERPMTAAALGQRHGIATERMEVLLQAGAALGLLKHKRGDRFGLTRKGAAMLGVPGLREMILHHDVLYRDLADPVAFLREETETELANFWPYVFGAAQAQDPDLAATYSDLMAQSQTLVAEDTLRLVSLKDRAHLLDIGGGTGAFLQAVGQAHAHLQMTLFDLPAVVLQARDRLKSAGFEARSTVTPGSFRDDPLPKGADTASLIRVLYDHSDETALALLTAVYNALPPGGRLIISEPMAGGARPDRAGDVYFAFYTMAMRTGRARSPEAISALCKAAGFAVVSAPKTLRPYVTTVLVADKSA
jgi:demethylspheroidene O-methyltransferase